MKGSLVRLTKVRHVATGYCNRSRKTRKLTPTEKHVPAATARVSRSTS